jgi:hypothetical protein
MRRVHIKGALVGVESITPEGLKSIYKSLNSSGMELIDGLQAFREHGIHVLGSFIFGLPTDKPETFAATALLAEEAQIAFAQFVILTPFPPALRVLARSHYLKDSVVMRSAGGDAVFTGEGALAVTGYIPEQLGSTPD